MISGCAYPSHSGPFDRSGPTRCNPKIKILKYLQNHTIFLHFHISCWQILKVSRKLNVKCICWILHNLAQYRIINLPFCCLLLVDHRWSKTIYCRRVSVAEIIKKQNQTEMDFKLLEKLVLDFYWLISGIIVSILSKMYLGISKLIIFCKTFPFSNK